MKRFLAVPSTARARGWLAFMLSLLLLASCGGSDSDTGTVDAAAAGRLKTALAASSGTPTDGSIVGINATVGTVQYVRLEEVTEVNGNPWASMAEFNLLDTNGNVLPRTGWKVSADSGEVIGSANYAIDGDPGTIWQTQWQGSNPPPPHAFTVNLGSAQGIGGFKYLPRQDGSANGRIANWNFYTSNDGVNWTLIAQGTFSNSATEKTVVFSSATAPVPAAGAVQYVRLEAVSEVNGNPWTSIAEFNLLDTSGAVIPRTGWTVTADSQELVGENGAATNAIDGNTNTYWHTQWLGGSPPGPHTFTVNLGTARSVGGFKYLPRQNFVNGRIANWRFYTSTDGVTWTLVAQGTFSDGIDEKTILLNSVTPTTPAPVAGAVQYVRLEAVTEVNGNPWTSIAEFNLLDTSGAVIPRAGWTVAADSQELVGENGAATNAIDGNTNTYWHTQWLGGSPPGPHTFTVNLGTAQSVGGFKYLPRQNFVNGRIANWRFYASTDGVIWTLVAQGTFAPGVDEKTITLSTATTPTPPTGASGQNPPIILNASTSARPGDVISLQGESFGSAPTVYFDGAPTAALTIVNRVATNWLAVQIPTTAQGALIVRINNGTGISAPVFLNAAKPLHLDTLQLVPGGAFRLFGRNLVLPGSTPRVTIDGTAATLDLAHSDEYMITATAPAGLKATSASVVVADNGNGSGPATLDRTIEVVTTATGDPFGLGVGWAAGFTPFATNTVNAATDARLAQKVLCDAVHDDTFSIQSAIEIAANAGGGVVRLPAGRCILAGSLYLRSKVVLQGAGMSATELVYGANYAFQGVGLDLTGIGNLTMTNSGTAQEGPLLKDSTRVFIQNLRVRLGTSRQMYLTGNRHFAVVNSSFEQTGSISHQGPYILSDTAGLLFEGNTTLWMDGAPTFARIHDSYVHANHFSRDGSAQNLDGVVHAFVMDFAYRIAVAGNTFDVVNGPITNVGRNDGETILTEGGGAQRTENLGNVASAGTRTLTDPNNSLQVDPFSTGVIPENYGVAIVGGKGAGQTRRLVAYSQPTLTVDRDWDIVPDSTSKYATFVWGLEKSVIRNNNLSQNPRGIWLYHTAVRDVDIIGNNISEGGGIYVVTFQNLSTKSFMPIYNVLVARNTVFNSTRNWMSYIIAIFVNTDARAFGIADIGIEMRSNQLTANSRPNVVSQTEEYAGVEGYMNMMRVENYSSYESSVMPRLLGSILANNVCTNCDVGIRISTGAGGTTILNTSLANSGVLLEDSASTANHSEKSTNTIVQ